MSMIRELFIALSYPYDRSHPYLAHKELSGGHIFAIGFLINGHVRAMGE